jgi:hypothetical protein
LWSLEIERKILVKAREREKEREKESERREMVAEASNEAMKTVAEMAPITAERKVRDDLDSRLPKPCNVLISFLFLLFYLVYNKIFFFFLYIFVWDSKYLK